MNIELRISSTFYFLELKPSANASDKQKQCVKRYDTLIVVVTTIFDLVFVKLKILLKNP